MKKKTKVILIGLAAIAFLLSGCLAYCYFFPTIRLSVLEPVKQSSDYFETPALSLSSFFGLPMPAKIEANIREFSDANNAVITEAYENYSTPWKVDCEIKVEYGQTIVTYSGTVTDASGNRIDYNRQLVFDFILERDNSILKIESRVK